MNPENVKRAVWCCIQETPTAFMGYTLYDPGAWPEPSICQKISMKVTEPWKPELSEKETEIIQRIKQSAGMRTQGKSEDEEARGRRRRENEEFLELLGIKKNPPKKRENER